MKHNRAFSCKKLINHGIVFHSVILGMVIPLTAQQFANNY